MVRVPHSLRIIIRLLIGRLLNVIVIVGDDFDCVHEA